MSSALPVPSARYRIAMVAASPFPYPQGSQVLVSQLAAALHRRGHTVRLVTYHSGVGPPPEGVEIWRSRALPGLDSIRAGPSWHKPLLDLLLVVELLRTVRAWQPDLLHAHNFEGLLAAFVVRRLTGVPVVYHVHNAMGLELHTYFGSRLGRWAGGVVGRWVDDHLARRADFCIVLNAGALDYFRQRGVDRLRLIPPGIDFAPGSAAGARAVLGPGRFVLYSGNLDRYQDLDLLFRAFQVVASTRPDVRLVLSTNARPGAWQAQANAWGLTGRVLFLPAEDFQGVRDLLAAADVTVCPRQVCLGFPIKLLNYMAAGCAIVAAAGSACGLRHLQDGWVVEPGDVAGLAEAIVALLDDPALARRLGDNARRRVWREYTWEHLIGAVEQVYQEIEKGRQP